MCQGIFLFFRKFAQVLFEWRIDASQGFDEKLEFGVRINYKVCLLIVYTVCVNVCTCQV